MLPKRRIAADSIRQGNLGYTAFRNQIACLQYLVDAPRITVGVAECHGDVGYDTSASLFGKGLDDLQRVESLFQGLALIPPEKFGRNGVGKSQGSNGGNVNSPLRALFVDHDADDLDALGHRDLRKDLF